MKSFISDCQLYEIVFNSKRSYTSSINTKRIGWPGNRATVRAWYCPFFVHDATLCQLCKLKIFSERSQKKETIGILVFSINEIIPSHPPSQTAESRRSLRPSLFSLNWERLLLALFGITNINRRFAIADVKGTIPRGRRVRISWNTIYRSYYTGIAGTLVYRV